jgi:hypothetical protein
MMEQLTHVDKVPAVVLARYLLTSGLAVDDRDIGWIGWELTTAYVEWGVWVWLNWEGRSLDIVKHRKGRAKKGMASQQPTTGRPEFASISA